MQMDKKNRKDMNFVLIFAQCAFEMFTKQKQKKLLWNIQYFIFLDMC